MRAEAAAVKLILDYDFHTVLDIGSGDGRATKFFRAAGKTVTQIELPDRFEESGFSYFDCVWCSHVLEHAPNVQIFLQKILTVTGLVAITVPPAKKEIVGGHLTLWNAGLLIYNMVVAGFDCREAKILKYGYNISVITPVIKRYPVNLNYDKGDIELLAEYFPFPVEQGFNGDIEEWNWYD